MVECPALHPLQPVLGRAQDKESLIHSEQRSTMERTTPPDEEMHRVSPNDPRPIPAFLREYAALVRRTGIYVDREFGLASPIASPDNEMETPEEHIARLYREERLLPPEGSPG